MNILFITPPPYLPNRLNRNRSFDLINLLSRDHNVFLLSVTTEKNDPPEFSEIAKVCKSVSVIRLSKTKAFLNCVLYPHLPLEVSFCKSEKVIDMVKKTVKVNKIDLVYVKRLRSIIYLPQNLIIPVIVDTTDAMSMFYQRMFDRFPFPKNLWYLLESLKYRRYEIGAMKLFNNWITCSEIDKKFLETLGVPISVNVIPNPVDDKYFQTGKKGVFRPWILFRGLMDKPVNVTAAKYFVREIMPYIVKKEKKAKLFIVGPNPTREIKSLSDNNSVSVTGYVSDIRKFLNDTALSVCPVLVGSGTRYKITQAWAMGKPVVSSTIGAEGLITEPGSNILISDSPKDFAEKVIKVLHNSKIRNNLSRNGLNTVLKYYSFVSVRKSLNRVLKKVVDDKK